MLSWISACTSTQISAFLCLYVAYGSLYFCRKPLSVSKGSLQSDLALSNWSLALIDSGFLASYTVGSFVVGRVTAAVDPRRLVCCVLVISAASSLVFCWCSSLMLLVISNSLNGLVQAFAFPCCITLLCATFDQEPSRVLGWWITCQSVGSAVSTALAASILQWGDWRVCIGFSSIAPLVGAAMVYSGVATTSAEPGDSPPAAQSAGLQAAAAVPGVLRLSAAYFLVKMVRYVLLLWLPFYLEQQLHYDRTTAGYTATLFDVGGVVGCVVCGDLVDRWAEGSAVAVVQPCCLLCAAALLALTQAQSSFYGLAASILVLGFGISGPDSLLAGVATQQACERQQVGPHVKSSACGMVNGFGAAGSVLQGTLVTAVGASGWNRLFIILSCCCVTAAAIATPASTKVAPLVGSEKSNCK